MLKYVCDADMNAYGKGPMSPVKLTEAQLLAMTQRDEILAMKEAFDTRLKVTDKISKQSRRRRKKALREYDRIQRQVEAEAAMSASDKIRRDLKLQISRRSESTFN